MPHAHACLHSCNRGALGMRMPMRMRHVAWHGIFVTSFENSEECVPPRAEVRNTDVDRDVFVLD